MMIPELIALLGGILWGVTGLLMAMQRGRVPSGYSLVHSIFATVGITIGITRWTPERIDAVLVVIAGIAYLLGPILFSGYLLYHYDNEEASREEPRTIT